MEINLDTIKFSEKSQIKILDLIWFLIIPIININYILASHTSEKGYDLTIKLDNYIEFNSIFVIPYIYWYIYIVIGFIFILVKSRREYIKTFISFFIGMSICYLIYYFFPTEINRPGVDNKTVFDWIVNLIYQIDKPFNCFPYLHVLTTYYIMRYTKYKDSKKVFYYTQIIGVLIILSTVFIKQHFVIDIFISIVLCEIIMFFVNKIKLNILDRMLNFPYEIKEKIILKYRRKNIINDEERITNK
ncbi:phosphatase PAP2 family protein [Clostridium celatum]|uniref:phosphatase PAP2 family protein n=1 Tax=Clostridium celatum TaxID=36834 RepID=UPI001F1838EE|nr:phosphatase PAP2 family protein [Clostridium celatum]MCE9656698.1 phosphatase PAP2 family protein [Clostridium celatum]